MTNATVLISQVEENEALPIKFSWCYKEKVYGRAGCHCGDKLEDSWAFSSSSKYCLTIAKLASSINIQLAPRLALAKTASSRYL